MDLSQPGFSPELPAKVDCVLHLAQSKAYRDFPAGAPDMLAVNVGGALQLLQWGHGRRGQAASSWPPPGNVYQPADRLHLESEPVMPASMYAASKGLGRIHGPPVRRLFFLSHPAHIRGLRPGPNRHAHTGPGPAHPGRRACDSGWGRRAQIHPAIHCRLPGDDPAADPGPAPGARPGGVQSGRLGDRGPEPNRGASVPLSGQGGTGAGD